jgi:broad specificity phosphatase PhoE
MKRLLFLFVIVCSSACAQQQITTFILVRHAEKDNDGTKDPGLTEAGKQRAEALSKMLKETKVDAIYSTPYKRTRNTVIPLALAKGLSVIDYDAANMSEIESMLRKSSGSTILLCGHSNTTPAIANYLAGNSDLKTFDDMDYGNILIVSVGESRKNAKVVWLRY